MREQLLFPLPTNVSSFVPYLWGFFESHTRWCRGMGKYISPNAKKRLGLAKDVEFFYLQSWFQQSNGL